MIQVAILGFGTVGSGVAEVLEENNAQISEKVGQPLRLKYILDVRDFPDSPFADRCVKDFSVIEQEPEVDVVVEERRKGDLWLACSDGLHGLVDDRQMRDALRQYAPEKAADVLLKAALDAGGRDNVTLVIVHDGEEPA